MRIHRTSRTKALSKQLFQFNPTTLFFHFSNPTPSRSTYQFRSCMHACRPLPPLLSLLSCIPSSSPSLSLLSFSSLDLTLFLFLPSHSPQRRQLRRFFPTGSNSFGCHSRRLYQTTHTVDTRLAHITRSLCLCVEEVASYRVC